MFSKSILAASLWLLCAHLAFATTTWNPSDKNAAIVLSNSNLTATTSSSSTQAVRSTSFYYTGKVYFEIKASTVDGINGFAAGLADAAASLSVAVSASIDAVGCRASNKDLTYNSVIVGACVVGTYAASTLEFAVDIDNNLIWIRSSNDAAGVWNGSGANDPATGTGGWPLHIGGGLNELYIAFSGATQVGVNDQAILNVGDSAFTGTVPTGFSAWGNGGAALPAGQTTWNPADVDTSIVLSDGNLRATKSGGSSSANGSVRSTTSFKSGKVYFEVTLFNTDANNSWWAGMADATASLGNTGNAFAFSTHGVGCKASDSIFYNSGSVGNCGTAALTAGTILEVAADLTNNLIWMRRSTDSAGVWNGSGANDPATGTGGISLHIAGGSTCVFIAFGASDAANVPGAAFINAGGSLSFKGSAPSGYSAWQSGGPGTCAIASNGILFHAPW